MNESVNKSIEIFISTYICSDQSDLYIPDYVVLNIYSLENDPVSFTNKLDLKYEGITKEEFNSHKKIKDLNNEVSSKKSSLMSNISRIKPKEFSEISVDDDFLKIYRRLYENYISQARWSREKPIKVFKFEETVLLEIYEFVQNIAEDIIELEVLKNVGDKLKFSERYNPREKNIQDKVADACWHELRKNPNLTVDELIKIALNDYIFRIYEKDKDIKEVNKKIEKAVRTRYKYIKNKVEK